jgi:CRP/FNR family transcriptional regulator, cyclic AMP receptor protein
MSNTILVDAVGYVAAILTLSVFYMRTMIPLRVLGIAANCAFIAYGALGGVYPNLVLHLILLPLNVVRLRQMRALILDVKRASATDLSIDWLKPFMTARAYAAGEPVFRKGEPSEAMFYTVSGRFRLPEIGKSVGPGELIGELGLVAPDLKRTLSFDCAEAGQLLVISYDEFKQLYYQNPQFGFYFLRIVSQRLFTDLARLQADRAAP